MDGGGWLPGPQACDKLDWYFTTDFAMFREDSVSKKRKGGRNSGRLLDGDPGLETNRRTESNPQVVMGAVFKVNLVAHVCSQTDWA